MAQQDKTTFEGTFNNSSTGLFKTNTTKDIGSDDLRTLVDNLTDSVPFNQDDKYTWPFPQVIASGTNTYTATPSPAITAYTVGQKFQILFTNANTGAATLALNGLAALALTKNGATALASGDIPAGSIKVLAYDGTRLQIVGDGGGGGTAATTSFTPAGTIAATDVQAALQELDTEKVPVSRIEAWEVPFTDEITPITATTNKLTFFWPYANTTITGIWAGLTTSQTSGSIFTIDVNKNGTTILSTKLTIDNTEKSSLTAATQPVISVSSITRGDEVSIDVDQQGDNTAKGAKVIFEFTRA